MWESHEGLTSAMNERTHSDCSLPLVAEVVLTQQLCREEELGAPPSISVQVGKILMHPTVWVRTYAPDCTGGADLHLTVQTVAYEREREEGRE